MITKIIITFSLILNIGLTLAQINENQTNGANSEEKSGQMLEIGKREPKNVFKDLFGFSMEEHQKNVEKNFKIMQKDFVEQEKQMRQELENVRKNLQNMFPTEPILSWIKSDGKISDPTDAMPQSGLPVFHPNNGSKFDAIPDDMKKVLDQFKPIIHITKTDSNKSEVNSEDPFRFSIELNIGSYDKPNDTINNETDLQKPFNKIMDNMFSSFSKAFESILDVIISTDNTTDVKGIDSNGSDVTNGLLGGEGWFGFSVMECKCPKGNLGEHLHDCPMHKMMGHHAHDEHKPATLTKEELEEKERLSMQMLLLQEGQQMFKSPDLQNPQQPSITIEERIQHEIKLISDNEYEWYDWLIVSLIAATSLILFVMTILLCIKRNKRSSKSVKISKVVAKADVESDNSVKNENYNQKGIEKIKTIFVNMK